MVFRKRLEALERGVHTTTSFLMMIDGPKSESLRILLQKFSLVNTSHGCEVRNANEQSVEDTMVSLQLLNSTHLVFRI